MLAPTGRSAVRNLGILSLSSTIIHRWIAQPELCTAPIAASLDPSTVSSKNISYASTVSAFRKTDFFCRPTSYTQASSCSPLPCSPQLSSHRGFASSSGGGSAPQLRYRVEVVTGDIRGAGTEAGASIGFLWENLHTDLVTLREEDGEEFRGFEQGETRSFVVEPALAQSSSVPPLGPPKKLIVRRNELLPTETNAGWYLEQVAVVEEETGERTEYYAQCWFGPSECGNFEGPVERQLRTRVEQNSITLEELAYDVLPPTGPPLRLHACGATVPHPAKVKQEGMRAVVKKDFGYGGEDAYFIQAPPQGAARHLYGLGVADGVYMWRMQGLDAGIYSRRVMEGAAQAVSTAPECSYAWDILQVAEQHVRAAQEQGSCTVCVLLMDGDHHRLTSANLGDSGFLLLRREASSGGYQVVYQSPAQEHEFGRPYQLGHHEASDAAADAMQHHMSALPGDVVVVGTDGLFDNITREEIRAYTSECMADAVQRQQKWQLTARAMSAHLTQRAHNVSLSKSLATPYSMAASEAFDMVYSGGKKDDITVLVGIVDTAGV